MGDKLPTQEHERLADAKEHEDKLPTQSAEDVVAHVVASHVQEESAEDGSACSEEESEEACSEEESEEALSFPQTDDATEETVDFRKYWANSSTLSQEQQDEIRRRKEQAAFVAKREVKIKNVNRKGHHGRGRQKHRLST